MDLSGVSLKPARGHVALSFIDDIDAAPVGGEDVPYEGLLAIVVGVGDEVKGVKKGMTVVVRPYARDGLRLGGTVITDAYCIAATISK